MSQFISKELLKETLGDKYEKPIYSLSTDNNTEEDSNIPNMRHWKDLGQYLDTLQPAPRDLNDSNDPSSMLLGKNRPLDQPMKYRICNLCGNPILEDVIANHIEECKERQETRKSKSKTAKANDPIDLGDDFGSQDTSDSSNNVKKTNVHTKKVNGNTNNSGTATPSEVNGNSGANNTKKRKQENGSSAATPSVEPESKKVKKERKKKEVKPKVNKNKGPVDVEKQCGVPLPNGGFCARSLTCKTHSMGAKRAVLGRSAPYDQLLAAYQRKNQAKIGAAAAAAQQAKDELEHSAHVALDDEEETQQVLEGVRRNIPFPLERKIVMPIRYRTKYLRMKEMFASSLLPRLTNNPLGALQSRAAVMNVDAINDQNVFPVRSQHQKNAQQKALLRAQQIQQAKIQASNGTLAGNLSQTASSVNLTSQISPKSTSMIGSPNTTIGNSNTAPLTGTQQQIQQAQMAQLAKAKALQAQMAQLRAANNNSVNSTTATATTANAGNGFSNINMASLTPTQRHLLMLEQQKRLQNYRS